MNKNALTTPYQGLPTPSKGSEANWEDIAQTEGGTGQQPNRAMLEDNPTTSSPLQSKRVTKPVDHLMMAMEKVFEKWLRITKQGPEQKSKGEIFFYQAMFPED